MSGFVWHDLMARDVDAAKAFYAELLGWTYAPFGPGEDGYDVFQAGDNGWGGVMAVPEPGMPSMWLQYAGVPDLDAAVGRVGGAGGHVQVPATPIPGVGRFAIVVDTQGAALGLFEAEGDGGPGRPATIPPGGIEWVELMASDLPGALPFLEAVLGWSARDVDMGGQPYTVLSADGVDVAGAMALPPEALDRGARSHWVAYVSVVDAGAAIATAGRLGAETLYGPIAVPGVGTVAGFHDPQGAVFAVLQPGS